MRSLNRNKQPFHYCLYNSKQEILDGYGNATGQYIVTYDDPVMMYANISEASGHSSIEQFGTLENYDKVIVTCDLGCPIDENSVLFIDKAPVTTNVITHSVTNSVVSNVTVSVPAPDYIVRRVSKSINSISIAVKKVEVS